VPLPMWMPLARQLPSYHLTRRSCGVDGLLYSIPAPTYFEWRAKFDSGRVEWWLPSGAWFGLRDGEVQLLHDRLFVKGSRNSSVAYLVSHHRSLGYGEPRCGFNTKHQSTTAPPPLVWRWWWRPPLPVWGVVSKNSIVSVRDLRPK